jgi:hypothetical protein
MYVHTLGQTFCKWIPLTATDDEAAFLIFNANAVNMSSPYGNDTAADTPHYCAYNPPDFSW